MSLQAEWGFFHWICPSAAGSEASSVDQKQPVFIWISEPDEAARSRVKQIWNPKERPNNSATMGFGKKKQGNYEFSFVFSLNLIYDQFICWWGGCQPPSGFNGYYEQLRVLQGLQSQLSVFAA